MSSVRVGAPQRRRPDTRLEFEVDHDRIVFSRAFRRLQDKTQVHPFAENDHVRRRLMHSIEAGSVGRSLGRRVGLALAEEGHTTATAAEVGQVVQNACIVHDIGNPPFGHSGEAAIRDWFRGPEADRLGVFEGCSALQTSDLQIFEGNAHGLRVVTRLENYSNAGGMRLTAATLGAFLKYPWSSADLRAEGGKFGFFESERGVVEAFMGECGVAIQGDAWARHPLVYLVEAADDVCYALADLEDGVELGVLGFDRVEALLLEFIEDKVAYGAARDEGRALELLRSAALRSVIPALAEHFMRCREEMEAGGAVAPLLDGCAHGSTFRAAQALAEQEVFSHPRKVYAEIGAFQILSDLLSCYIGAVLESRRADGSARSARSVHLLRLMGNAAPTDQMDDPTAIRRVVDHLAGMTDGYAARVHQRIMGSRQR